MKPLKWLLLFAILFITGRVSFAQLVKEKAMWASELKKKGQHKYEVVFHLELDKGWHVYANTDDSEKGIIAPSFNFERSNDITIVGETKSKGIIETKKLRHKGVVDFYSFKVLYVQEVTAKPGSTISGSYTYRAFNEKTDLPPQTETFKFIAD